MDLTLLIFYATLALGVSFLCSIFEAVVLSIPHTQIAVWQKEGKKVGDLWAHLKEDDAIKPLTAILTLNTIAHTMGAAGVGSQVYELWGDSGWDFLGIDVLTFSSIILTFAVLILSEIIPKTLGTAYWKGLAPIVGPLLDVTTRLLMVFIAPIQILKSLLPKGKHSLVTRDDVAAIADLGEEEGILEEDEEAVIHNLLKLRDITVESIMTPRVVMTAFKAEATVEQVIDENPVIRFSRIPVYEENVDSISGVVIRSQVLMAASRDEYATVMRDMMKPAISILINESVDHALDLFLEKKQQFAIVKDEFGGTAGIVTMEDVLETLLGEEIVDELDEVEDMRELAKEQAAAEAEAEEVQASEAEVETAQEE